MTTYNTENIKLHQIILNVNNPRKSYNEESLAELAENIKAQGVIQPIMVHKRSDFVDEDMYEIIYGERRCRASKLAGCDTIPAIIRENLSQTQILEIALVENLQREDISPLEEYLVYQQLIENSGYDIELLMARFAKSESYIRSRMKLSGLIEEYRPMLINGEISLSVALELCKYSIETQFEVYEDHYTTTNSYQDWKTKRSKEVVEMLKNSYSSNLEDYFFDKLECYNCNYNTQVVSLFTDDDICGRCMNRQCLKAKNTTYIVERAIEAHERNPELPLARNGYRYDEGAVEELSAKGYEVQLVQWCRECPIQPNEDDYLSEEQYKEELDLFIKETAEITEKYQKGEIAIYALIGTRGVTLSYRETSSTSSTQAETPLQKLENQDSRNKEIAVEKTIADVKNLVNEIDVTQGEFSSFEDQITYFAMAKSLRREHFELVGIDPDTDYLTDEDRWTIAYNLTDERRTIIKRDFILSNFKDAQRGNYTAVMLLGYADQHAQERVNEIKATHDAVYEKRHTRIEEKIAAIKGE